MNSRLRRLGFLGSLWATILLIMAAWPGSGLAQVRESILYLDGTGAIYRVSPDGSGSMKLLATLSNPARRAVPLPDGLTLVGQANNQLFTATPEGLTTNSISIDSWRYTVDYAVSPDGSQVAFAAKEPDKARYGVYVMNMDGSGVQPLAYNTERDQWVFDWGPTGVLFRDYDPVTKAFPLWVIDPGSGARQRLSPADFNAVDARFSPDGSKAMLVGKYQGTTAPNRLYLWTGGSTISEVSTTPTLVPNSVDWDPTGMNRVAVSASAPSITGTYHIYLVNLDNGLATELARNKGTTPTNYLYWGLLSDPLFPTNLTVAAVTGQYSDSVNLTASLKTHTGSAVAGHTIAFMVNGNPVGTADTDPSGNATLPYRIQTGAGALTVEAYFFGNPQYAASSGTGTLTVNREGATLAYTGPTVMESASLPLSATITQDQDTSLGDITLAGSLLFTVKKTGTETVVGTFPATINADGTARTVANIPVDLYEITLSLPTNPYFTASPVTARIVAGTVISVDAEPVQYSDEATLTATLRAGATGVAGKTLSFRLNGTAIGNATTDVNGVATLTHVVTLPAGAATVEVRFAGDASYAASTGTGTLSVLPEGATLVYDGDMQSTGGPIKLSATLAQDADGFLGNITLAGKVRFELVKDGVFGATYEAAVGPNGKASVTTPALTARTYTVRVSLVTEDRFTALPVEAMIKGLPQVTVTAPSVQYSDVSTMSAVLTAEGEGVPGKSLTFRVAGNVVGTATTDASGLAMLPHKVMAAGNLPVVVEFSGDLNLLPATGSASLAVTPEGASLQYTGQGSMPADGLLQLSAKLTEDPDGSLGDITQAGSLTFTVRKLGGAVAWTGTAPIQADGTASVTTDALPNEAYNIEIRLPVNGYYVADSATGKVRSTANLTVGSGAGQYSDQVPLQATFDPVAPGKMVRFVVNGTQVGTAPSNATGVATFAFKITQAAGSYTVEAIFDGDDDYTGANATSALTVTRENGTITYTGAPSTAGGPITLSVRVADEDSSLGDISLAGPLRFEVRLVNGGTLVANPTASVDAVGTATATVSISAEPHYVTISQVAGNTYYQLTPGTATLKSLTSMALDDASGIYSDNVTLRARMTPGVADREVTFALEGSVIGTGITDATGEATLTYKVAQPQGSYAISASITDDEFFIGSSAIATLTVGKESASLEYAGDTLSGNNQPINLRVRVIDDPDTMPGDLTRAGKVEFTLTRVADGQQFGPYQANVGADGFASVNTPNLEGRTYAVDYRLLENGYYQANAGQATIYGTTMLSTATQAGEYSDRVDLTASLLVDGVPLTGHTVTFAIDGTTVGTAPVGPTGVATRPYVINLPQGTYAITVSFDGGGTYAPATASATLTVSREQAELAYTGPTEMPANGQLNLSAKLTEVVDPTPGDLTRAGSIAFVVKKLGGQVAWSGSAPVQANGTASVTTPVLDNEAYNVEISLVANGYYAAGSISAKVKSTVTLTVAPVAGQYSDNVTLQATFAPVAPGKVVNFTVNGIPVGSATSGPTGVAPLTYQIRLSAGTYTIGVSFAGDDDYTAATATGTLIVTREDGALAYAGDRVTGGGPINLRAQVAELAGDTSIGDLDLAGPIQFVLKRLRDNQTVTVNATVDASGTATAIATLDHTPYELLVQQVTPNNYYALTSDTVIVKAATSLVASAATGQYSDDTTLTATLSPAAAGKTVTFSIGGSTIGTGTTNAAGVATAVYKVDRPAGTYVVTAAVAADPHYEAASVNFNLVVTHEEAELAYTGEIIANNNAPINLRAVVSEKPDLSPGNITLAGKVEFELVRRADGQSVGTFEGTINASGVATATTGPLPGRTYDVIVRLLPNGYYVADEIPAVIYGTTSLTAENASGDYSDEVDLTATLLVDDVPLVGQTVVFRVDGNVVGSAPTGASGVATLPYTITLPFKSGGYTITASFDGGGSYQPVSHTATLTVSREQATLAYTGDTEMPADNRLKLSATLAEVLDGSLGVITNAGSIEFTVKTLGGVERFKQTAPLQANGAASLTTGVLPNEAYTIDVQLVPNDYYTAAGITAKVKSSVTLTVPNRTGQYSDDVTLQAQFAPQASGKLVSFSVNGTPVGTALSNGTGLASISYNIKLPQGSYTVSASFAGDDDYTAATATGTLTVQRETGTITYNGPTVGSGGALTLSASVTETPADPTQGDLTLSGPLLFVLTPVGGGTPVTVNAPVNASGFATATSPALSNVPYEVAVSQAGSNNYYQLTGASAVIKATTSIVATGDSAQYSDEVTLTATLTPSLSAKTVTFSIGGTPIGTGTTNASGVATLTHKVTRPEGSYTVTATFADETYYQGSSATATMTVTKEDAELAYTGTTIAGNNVPLTLRAQVTQAPDGSLGDITLAGPVEFVLTHTVDGSPVGTYTATVDASGVATATTGNLPARTYTVRVRLQDSNGYFVATPATAQIYGTVGLTVPNASEQYSDVVELTATLVLDGSPLSGQEITFKVDGNTVGTAQTGTDGVAKLNYTVTQPVGSYPIEASFDGAGLYPSATANGRLAVAHENAGMAYTGQATLPADGRLNLSVKLTEETDASPGEIFRAGSIHFVVKRPANGSIAWEATVPVQPDGTASVTTTPLGNNAHEVLITLVPNGYYLTNPSSITFPIKGNSMLAVANTTGDYSDQVTLSATFAPAAAGKAINFTVNGNFVGSAPTNASGVAALPYTIDLAQSGYAIEASFAGDTEFNGSSAIGILTVNRERATLTYTGPQVTSGGAINLSAQLAELPPDTRLGDWTRAGQVRFVLRNALTNQAVGTYDGAVNSSGVASVTTPSLANVPYTVELSLLPNNYYQLSATPAVSTIRGTTVINVTTAGAQFSDNATLTANVGRNEANIPVTFQVNGTTVGTANTNASGVATLTYKVAVYAGDQPVITTTAITPLWTAGNGSGTLPVTAENATVTYTGETVARGWSQAFTLSATVAQAADGNLGDITRAGNVQFTLVSANRTLVFTAPINAAGLASTAVSIPKDQYQVSVDLAPAVAGQVYFTAPTVTRNLLRAGDGVGLLGQYYDNVDFTTTGVFTIPVATRIDPTINFNWYDNPNPLPVTMPDRLNFSVVWTGWVQPLYSENYQFCFDANDGIRVWVNNLATPLINQWTTGTKTNICTANVNMVAGQKYDIRVEYGQNNLTPAHTRMYWQSASQAREIIPETQLYPAQLHKGTGLLAQYYSFTPPNPVPAVGATWNYNVFQTLRMTRIDPQVSFNWDTGTPAPTVPAEQFAVRWTGKVTPTVSGNIQFCVYSDDGVRLWVNNMTTPIIDQWKLQSPILHCSGNINVTAGVPYDIRYEFFEHTGQAYAELYWKYPTDTATIAWLRANNRRVPQAWLSTDGLPAPAGVAATALSNSQIRLTWNAYPANSPMVMGYVIYRSTTPGFTPSQATLLGYSNGAGTTWVDGDRDPNTTYYYRIASVDTAGNESDRSIEVSATTLP